MKTFGKTLLLSLAAVLTLWTSQALAHCEVPCGIYDDEARLAEIAEHITTIEKAMAQIEKLEKSGSLNANQQTRWINNKEKHAVAIQEIVWQYFLTQRVKPVASDSKERGVYLEKLSTLHEMSVTAMKCKQTLDAKHAANLKSLLDRYAHLAGHKHP